jgi:hypothetical protein
MATELASDPSPWPLFPICQGKPRAPALIERIARCFVAVAVIAYVIDLLRQTRDGLTDGAGRPFGDDFINFWSGPFLAWHHRIAEIYNFGAFHAFEQSVVGEHLQGYHYSYPPTLLVLMAPLVLVPYVPALFVWIAGGWFAFYRALRLAMPTGRTLLLALATPAVFINTVGGQNGTWTAAIFGFGLGLLDRQPFVAGGILGLLIYKPQFGLLIPLALLAGRRWQAMAAAAITGVALVVLAATLWGPEIFADYLRQISSFWKTAPASGTACCRCLSRRVGSMPTSRRLMSFKLSSPGSSRLRSPYCGFAMRPLESEMPRSFLAPAWRRPICRTTTWCSARWSWRGCGKTKRCGGCPNRHSFSPAPQFF